MKNQFFQLRLSDGDRMLIEAVSLATGVTLSEYMRSAAVEAARDWLRQRGAAQESEVEDVRATH